MLAADIKSNRLGCAMAQPNRLVNDAALFLGVLIAMAITPACTWAIQILIDGRDQLTVRRIAT